MEQLQLLPDLLDFNLKIVFVGYNPSLRSAEVGHNFAGPSNRFWKILYQARITPRLYSYYEDGLLLELGFGLTNIVARPTKSAAEITREEFRTGRDLLKQKLVKFQPGTVCYVGSGVYKAFTGKERTAWGFQTVNCLPGINDFVAPNTSGLVRISLAEQTDIYTKLQASL